MTKCPFCGFDNDDGALFCEQCKSDLGMMMALGMAMPAEPAPLATPPVAEPIPGAMLGEAPPLAPVAVPEAVALPLEAVPFQPVDPLAGFAPAVPTSPPLFEEAVPPLAAPVAEMIAVPVAAEFLPPEFPVAQEPAPPEVTPVVVPLPAPDEPPLAASPVALAPPVAPPAMPEPTPWAAAALAAPFAPPEAFTSPLAAPVVETPPPEPLAPPPHAAPAAQAPTEPAAGKLQAGAQPRLKVIRGQKIGMEFPIYPDMNFIGRADEKPVDIDLEDQEPPERVWCSRQHALITFEDDLLTIEDLNSANGTYVNRGRVYPGQKRQLIVNDVIQIGTVQMKLIV